MESWAAPLAAFPGSRRVAFPYFPDPSRVVLDLAIQAAGRISVPVSVGAPARLAEGCARVEIEDLPPGEDREGEALLEVGMGGTGGAVVLGPDGEPAELSQAELIAAAERIGQEIPPGRPGGRDVLVLGGRLEEPAERALLAWAIVAGAALLLEPVREGLVATAVWARPTVFAGTAGEVARLRHSIESEGSRWWRRRPRPPFGRLRAVIRTDAAEAAAEDAGFWEELGVVLLPQSGKAVVYSS